MRPNIRAGVLMPPAGAALFSLVVMTVVRVASGSRGAIGLALQAAILMLACGARFALDDPSETTVAAAPTTLLVRRFTRLTMSAAVIALAWGALLLLSGLEPHAIRLSVVLAGLAGVAVAAAALLRPLIGDRSGLAASSVVLALVLAMSRLPDRWAMVPSPGSDPQAGTLFRWAAVTVVAAVVVMVTSRDPARPRRPGRSMSPTAFPGHVDPPQVDAMAESSL